MGALTSRQNATVEEDDVGSNHAYKYPPRSGSYFGSHFIMGGERFDTPQPEAYLFGENADLNFLGSRPTAFPYPPPQANEPTKTLKSLVNIRKESVRFVRAPDSATKIHGDGGSNKGNSFNIEFVFDSDAKCAITIFYFCTEETSPSGITYIPKESLTSETYHYKKGVNQHFSQPSHIFNPNLFSEDDLTYNAEKDIYPVAIHCVVEEECRQSHTTICVIDHHTDGTYVLRALKQKIFVDGLCYLLQEIYGIENKTINKPAMDDDTDDNGSECVICMSDTRDTLILPCRHLCLCNSCADSLRFQANNCPICRAPFRALLQIKAVQKGGNSNILAPQNSPDPNSENVPARYIPVSLIEALNGPPQCIVRTLSNESGDGDVTAALAAELLNKPVEKTSGKSPKSGSHKRSKSLKVNNESSGTEFRMSILNSENTTSETDSNLKQVAETQAVSSMETSQTLPKDKSHSRQLSRESLKIVNERHSLKLQPSTEQDDDSDSEKLSPLLSQNNKNHSLRSALHIDGVDESIDADTDTDADDLKSDNSKKRNRPALSAGDGNILAGAEDSDYYTPEDPQTTILSPLCPENPIGEKIPPKENIVATTSPIFKNSSPLSVLKESHNSLPDSPISTGNPSSTRSSNDSYSSSSSTKQLLTPNLANVTDAKVDDDKSFSSSNTINV